jgi:predicted nucleic acid-binding protein
MPEPRIFLDTSALFAAVMSATGGARALLKLGEAGLIVLYVGPTVLREADEVFRRKAADLLPLLAALLDRANVQVCGPAEAGDQSRASAVVGYGPDAQMVAEALTAGADFLVTHDQVHLLNNPKIHTLSCRVGAPGDCLTWLRARFSAPTEGTS